VSWVFLISYRKSTKSVFLLFILGSSILLLTSGSNERTVSTRQGPRDIGYAVNTTEWYVNTTNWVNITLIQGVKISLSRIDGKIHWYWPTNPQEDRIVSPWGWSAIRVETWGYNDGQRFENSEEITITESSDKSWILVNETWLTPVNRETKVELHMVFHREVPWFYCYAKQTYMVEPNHTTLSEWYRVGLQPQVCVFLGGSDFIYTPSPFNESKITQEVMPVTHQWMERFEKFPWIAMHDQDDNATVGVIVLNTYPPCYDLMANDEYANNQEAQISFMSGGYGGVSECWYFPKDFSWYTQFVVYPCFDDTPPYYDKIDDLAKSLYHPSFTSTNFDSSFASASHSPVSFDWPAEKGQPFIINKIGCISAFLTQGIIFWNGTFPRHYSGHPDDYMLNFDQQYYSIASDSGYVYDNNGYNSTIAGTDSRYGYHVQCWKQQTFNYSAYEFDVEFEHTWEAWNDSDKFLWTITIEVKSDSNLTKAYFWMNKGNSKVIQLNSTTWEVYNETCWGAEPSITLIFKNSTIEYSNGSWICYLVNNTSQKQYLAGKKFQISFYLWLHYGHITETNQISPIHTIQPQNIAPFRSHFHRCINDHNVTEDFSFWTNATFIDARITYSPAEGQIRIVETGNGIGTTKIYCGDYGEPERVQVNRENISFQFNEIDRVLTLCVAFSSAEKKIATILICIPDTNSPKTKIAIGSPSHTQNGNIYVNSSTYFTLNATDGGFGIAYVSLKIDDEPWTNYSKLFTLAGYTEGAHLIRYFAVDKTANVEEIKTTEVIIDDLAPTTTCHPTEGIYSRPITINFTSIDNAAGVKETLFRRSSEEKWTLYTGPFIINKEGHHKIFYYSVDILGNKEHTKSSSYTLKKEIHWTFFIVTIAIALVAVASAIAIIRTLKRKGKKMAIV